MELKLDTCSDDRTAQHWEILGAGQAVTRWREGRERTPGSGGEQAGNQRWEVGHVEQEADAV